MGKVYTCFHTKTAQKPYPMGQQIRESIEQNSRHTQMITHLNEGARQGRDRLLPLACTLSPQKFKYQHVVWRNPTKRIRKYSNDFRDSIYATTCPLKIHIYAAIRDILWTEKILKQNSHHFLSQDIHFSEKLACSSLWDSQVHKTNTGWNLEIENALTQE